MPVSAYQCCMLLSGVCIAWEHSVATRSVSQNIRRSAYILVYVKHMCAGANSINPLSVLGLSQA